MRLYVWCGFGLEKDRDAIANGISEAAMRAAKSSIGLGREWALADGTCDEIEKVLGDHGSILRCDHRRMQPKRYFISLAGRFTISRNLGALDCSK
jgi:hypothetical protein